MGSEQSSSLQELNDQLRDQRDDALWRERVAELAVGELLAEGGIKELRESYEDIGRDYVLDRYDGERVITIRDVFYILERMERTVP